MKKHVVLTGVLLSLATVPAMAEWGVNVGPIWVAPDSSSSNLDVIEQVAGLPEGSTEASVNNNTQLGLTIDYRFTPNWGVQLIAATPFSHDIKVKGSAIDGLNIGDTKHLPPTLLAQYYFDTGSDRVQPFVGLGLNYTTFFSESVHSDLTGALQDLGVTTDSDTVSLSLKDSFGFALQVGINIKFTDNLGAHLMVSKMDIETTGRVRVNGNTIQSVDVQIDPVVAMAGLRWNF
ncbi:hypothetical protein CWE09_04220 [Aliidiomarina minuta]|uniref:OmpW family protein n=1 Tax=Aliidiomarina minuta TaxID=880057 RepID=A0A432W7G3_9GAMM|nr:OmpW family outer membrane protein [Aliidiomarina minuta]RUO25939.1 hypothetical protein CWE09_04220 [Aliidiomarina minuta]